MMRGKFADEDERVVYYDLDADAHSRQLLLSADAVSAPTQATITRAPTQVFRRAPQPLFNLEDSGDEAEEKNPFASLLQQPAPTANPLEPSDETPVTASVGEKRPKQQKPVSRSDSKAGDNGRSILRHAQAERAPTRLRNNKKLGFEAADSRPARWSARKPSATDTNNRRKSLGAIQKRRAQLEKSPAKRRKSMPATPSKRSNLMDDSQNEGHTTPKRRLLSDVLQRATTLSQQQHADNSDASFSQMQPDENPVDGDAILDTEHQMRVEPFAPQIFSPSKPAAPTSGTGRQVKTEAVVSKIRGEVGDVIRKAIRKSNRDLTLLRSRGQHLLPQKNSSSLGTMESIQERAFATVCIKRHRGAFSHFTAFECKIHELAGGLQASAAGFLESCRSNASPMIEALYIPQTAEYLKLAPGMLLKVYQPLHFVPQQLAVGYTGKANWFLVCTQLTEVMESNHDCSVG